MNNLGNPSPRLNTVLGAMRSFVTYALGTPITADTQITPAFLETFQKMLNDSLPKTEVEKVQEAMLRSLCALNKSMFRQLLQGSRCEAWLLWASVGTILHQLGLINRITVRRDETGFILTLGALPRPAAARAGEIDEEALHREITNNTQSQYKKGNTNKPNKPNRPAKSIPEQYPGSAVAQPRQATTTTMYPLGHPLNPRPAVVQSAAPIVAVAKPVAVPQFAKPAGFSPPPQYTVIGPPQQFVLKSKPRQVKAAPQRLAKEAKFDDTNVFANLDDQPPPEILRESETNGIEVDDDDEEEQPAIESINLNAPPAAVAAPAAQVVEQPQIAVDEHPLSDEHPAMATLDAATDESGQDESGDSEDEPIESPSARLSSSVR